MLLSELKTGEQGVVVGVQDHTTAFLQYLGRMELVLGTPVQLLEFFEYDESMRVLINEKREQVLSKKVCQNLFIQKR